MTDYTEYLLYKKSLDEKLELLNNISDNLDYNTLSADIKKFRNSIKNDQFIITVVGEFNRGKSTLLNALIEEDIIPTGILPTTATINIIRYDEKKQIIIHDTNDNSFEIPFKKDAFLNYTALVDFDPNKIKYVEITLSNSILEGGVVLVDTPGVNDINEQRIEITYGYLPISDAIIFLMNSTTPLKITEVDFLTNHLLSNNIKKIFFVTNQIDLLDDTDQNDSVSSLKENLKSILKDQNINVYPVSSKEALLGILLNDSARVAKSGITDFKNVLIDFLHSEEKTISKIERLNSHLDKFINIIIDEIESEKKLNQQSYDDLIKLKENLLLQEQEIKNNFSRLLTYIDEQSAELLKRIEGSLLIKMKELNEAFNFQIDKYQSDITDYVEKDIPYSIKQSLKLWYEQSQSSIDNNVYAIYQKSIQGFEQHFAKLTIINNIINVNRKEVTVNPSSITLSKTNIDQDISKKTFMAGAITLGIIATVASGGLLTALFGAISGGTIAQRFLGQNMIKKEVKIQKAELKSKLPLVLSETFNSFYAVIDKNMRSTFNELKNRLNKEFNSNLSKILEDINRNIFENTNDVSKINSRTEILLKNKNRIELLIKE